MTTFNPFCNYPQCLFLWGILLSQLSFHHPDRAFKTLILIGQWLWTRYDCPLQRIIVFALLAAIPVGINYGRFEDGFIAFLLFTGLAFEGWRRCRRNEVN